MADWCAVRLTVGPQLTQLQRDAGLLKVHVLRYGAEVVGRRDTACPPPQSLDCRERRGKVEKVVAWMSGESERSATVAGSKPMSVELEEAA